METRINLIITFQDYLNSVNFFKKSRKEQIAYMMYYVINVSGLRDDMQPQIICHRINDQLKKENKINSKYGTSFPPAEEDEIREIIINNIPDFFEVSVSGDDNRDRALLDNKTAYIISESKKKEIDKEFNKKLKQRYIRKMAYEKIWMIILFVSFFLLGSFVMCEYYNTYNKLGISLLEYKRRTNIENMKNEDKALYFLFYITEIEGLKKEMSPQVISDRLYDISSSKIDPDSIKVYFNSSNLVIESKIKGEYRMSSDGKKELSKVVGIDLDYSEKSIIDFWTENTPFKKGGLTITLLTMIIASVFAFAFQFGKKLNYPD